MTIDPAKSILVIDDDEVFRKRLARAFRNRGYEVFEASDLMEARCQLQMENVSNVILDLKLGSHSGLSLLHELKDFDKNLKVVVLTGYGTIATAVEAIKLGAIHYLSKPVDADSVLAVLTGDAQPQPQRLTTPHLEQVEWEHIQRVVRDCGGNISHASKELGLHRRSLQRKLAKNPPKLR